MRAKRSVSYHLTWLATTVALACGGKAPQVAASGAAEAGGAGGAAAAEAGLRVSLDDVTPLFRPGERLTFEVSFRGIEGGRARVAVGAPAQVNGRRVLPLRAEAESAGIVAVVKTIRDDVATWLDADTALPVRVESDANTSGKRVRVLATFPDDGRRAHLDIDVNGKKKQLVRQLPLAETYDPLGALLVMRAWEAPVGARATIYTIGGQRVWKSELVFDGREELKTPLYGKVRVVRLSGVSTRLTVTLQEDTRKPPRRFSVWITDDARRVPVKITAHTELGDVNAVATSYEGGTGE